MLLAGEGGSFFYSSAAGYSNALTLLILGQRKTKKPMKITPCNQYQLVNQETDPELLASSKNWLVWRCNSFLCFDCTTNQRDGSSPVKVGVTPDKEISTSYLNFDEGKDLVRLVEPVSNRDESMSPSEDSRTDMNMDFPKGIEKKSATDDPDVSNVVDHCSGDVKNDEASSETDIDLPFQIDKRKVQWTDITGGELFEIREFEMSEVDSGDELDHFTGDTCSGDAA